MGKKRTIFDWLEKAKYTCKLDWPDNCMVQGGRKGLVIDRANQSTYSTAFFEAFPQPPDPDTFVRGEGETLEDAEADAWAKLEKYRACDHPDFERRSHTSGAGYCVKCGMFKMDAFEPLTKCKECGVPTTCSLDVKNDWWYCEEHKDMNENVSPLISGFEDVSG